MLFLTIILFIAILGLLVLVHEFGHFIMARKAGMRVEEFGFGFPPRLFGIRRKGTLYSFNLIPFGGFVKILGENGESSEAEAFASKSALARLSVLVAGVTMNAILAWALLAVTFTLGVPTVIDHGDSLPRSATVSEAKIAVLFVEADSPAATAGLKPGDAIQAINSQTFSSIQELQKFTAGHATELLDYTVSRGGTTFHVKILPRAQPPAGQGPIGVALGMLARVSYPWYEALWRGGAATIELGQQIIISFARLVANLFGDRSLVGSLTGPIGIAVLTRDAAQLGIVYVLQFTALLSINLAIINILPFPALDGGRVLFLLIERLRNRKLNQTVEQYANTLGFVMLIALLLWISARDVNRFSNQFHSLWQRIVQSL